MKYILVILLLLVFINKTTTAQRKTENLVIITLDGMRWQEVFKGADSALIADKRFTKDSDNVIKTFWSDDVNERRKKLFPFLWSTIESEGQLYGNRTKGNDVNNANRYWFSYPGYNEIFTGYPDTAVNSNDTVRNKNTNVLEFINQQNIYHNKVAVFSSWNCFPYILNKWRSGLFVNSDKDTLHFDNPQLKLVNDEQLLAPEPLGLRPDMLTYFAGREYLKAYKPKVLYIAFDETDDYAHAGMYDQYLDQAHAEDGMVADMWKLLQSMPEYKNKTTVIVTCDHGRGDSIKEQWTSHGSDIAGSGQIWIAAIGPDTKPIGEVTNTDTLYQRQLATTFAALLGLNFNPDHPVMKPINQIISK